ncbi:MAG: hypothetical protein EOO39_00565, partial [Cytophagaceae bacterium]
MTIDQIIAAIKPHTTIEIKAEREDSSHRGQYDQDVENSITKMIKQHGQWGWCVVTVKASFMSWESEPEYLGGCSYKSKKDFIEAGDYYDDMVNTCLTDIAEEIQDLLVTLGLYVKEPIVEEPRVTIAKGDRDLYCIREGKGYGALGFDVCIRWRDALATELERTDLTTAPRGSIEAYDQYESLVKLAGEKYAASKNNWTSKSQLTPEFIGHEGKSVTVTNPDGSTQSFKIGKSTGFIPIHLTMPIKGKSVAGGAVCLL